MVVFASLCFAVAVMLALACASKPRRRWCAPVVLMLVAGLARADERLALDLARARAEACFAVAQLTGKQPCISVECKAAEAQAAKLVAEAVKQPVVKTADRIAVDGKIYTRRADGHFWLEGQGPAAGPAPASVQDGGCRVINGKMVCPLQR